MISLGLIGCPLAHSLSPIIHKAALDFCGLKGKYSLFPILPNDLQGLRDLLDRMRSGEITGVNVTIPHKQSIISLLDELTQTAQSVGAVNTVYMENGKLTADNTDAPGFLADLYKFLEAEDDKLEQSKNALVLGAGGAARAVIYSLINDGWKVVFAARRFGQTQALIAQFPDKKSRLTGIDFLPDAFTTQDPDLRLVINTTPVGMSPNIENSPWPPGVHFPPRAAFYDLVYNTSETKFVRDARAAGLQAVSGMGMLVEQAALAFEIWTGYNVPRETLFTALEEK
jgi:shikimate dehydrogenase